MASRRSASRGVPTEERVLEIFRSLQAKQDADLAIMAASYLDYGLEQMITHRFANAAPATALFQPGSGALASFNAKIHLAHALGLIGPLAYADLRHVATVRNAFAHTLDDLDFNAAKILAACGQLRLVRSLVDDQQLSLRSQAPRDFFLATVQLLLSGLFSLVAADPAGRVIRRAGTPLP